MVPRPEEAMQLLPHHGWEGARRSLPDLDPLLSSYLLLDSRGSQRTRMLIDATQKVSFPGHRAEQRREGMYRDRQREIIHPMYSHSFLCSLFIALVTMITKKRTVYLVQCIASIFLLECMLPEGRYPSDLFPAVFLVFRPMLYT